VVVIGGGVIGNSVAYHLAQHAGWGSDVVVLERDQLTSGTTWHAAGLMVTFGSLSETATEIRKYSKELYSTLEAETGQSTGFMPVGFIELATSADRLEEYRRVSAFNRRCGIDVQEISPSEVQSLFPLCNVDDVEAGFYVPTDGRVNPVDCTMALSKGARQKGVRIYEGITVTDVQREDGKVSGVTVRNAEGEASTISAEIVVNCAGMWARQLGEMSGVSVPNQAAEHYYLLTEPMDDVDPSWPVVEDPSSYTYIRPEGGGLMVGMFEGEGAPWSVGGVPADSSFLSLDADWERMAPYLEQAMARVPRTLEVGAKQLFCGPESFTPDLAPIVGEAPELRNYFVAAGLNSIGILSGPGIGRLLAEWIVGGTPHPCDDVTGMHIDRLHRFMGNPEFRAARVAESLGNVYKCHYPTKSVQSARGARRSPLHDRLLSAGGQFKDVSGWESPDWCVVRGCFLRDFETLRRW
jgi:4-methylaminobutanoate oxidase (formaldehyde-forming)